MRASLLAPIAEKLDALESEIESALKPTHRRFDQRVKLPEDTFFLDNRLNTIESDFKLVYVRIKQHPELFGQVLHLRNRFHAIWYCSRLLLPSLLLSGIASPEEIDQSIRYVVESKVGDEDEGVAKILGNCWRHPDWLLSRNPRVEGLLMHGAPHHIAV